MPNFFFSMFERNFIEMYIYPAICPLTIHGLQSSTIEKLRDLIHACVPTNGTNKSWSPLHINLQESLH